MFPIGQRALRNVRRVWRLMTICVGTGFSTDESHGRTSRRSRTRKRNRQELSHGRNHDLAASREQSRRAIILRIADRVDERSGREDVRDRIIRVARRNPLLKMRRATSSRSRRLRSRHARNLVWSAVNQRRRK
jgi:hypothetical protein